MKLLLIMILGLLVFSGCQPSPRFRAGEARKPDSGDSAKNQIYNRRQKENGYTSVTTGDLLKLGRILQSYLGTPYQGSAHGDKNLDCSGFTMTVFEKFNNTQLPRTTKKQFRSGRKVSKQQLRYGDLVFFKTNRSSVSHVGIYVGFNEFVHASTSNGIIISNLSEKYWKKRYAGARRILP
jgi:cell wall-associated NlpC family hydrolase